jgi:hypothetical protein
METFFEGHRKEKKVIKPIFKPIFGTRLVRNSMGV